MSLRSDLSVYTGVFGIDLEQSFDCFSLFKKQCFKDYTDYINLTLTEGSFLAQFKSALISPLLKEPSLDKDSMRNSRPMSNLSFAPKVLEKVWWYTN